MGLEETLLLFEDEGQVEEEAQEASHDGVFQCGKWRVCSLEEKRSCY